MKKERMDTGWNNENKKCNKLQKSRKELVETLFTQEREIIPLSIYTKNTNYDRIRTSLNRNGVVFLRNLFSKSKIKEYYQKSVELTDFILEKKIKTTIKNRSYKIDPTQENKYIDYLMIFSKGRYDITTLNLKTILLPKIIQKLLRDCLDCCNYKIDIGFIPIFPNTKEKGPYHRDTKALFSWNTLSHEVQRNEAWNYGTTERSGIITTKDEVKRNRSGIVECNVTITTNTNEADKKDITCIPDYYYTLLINLHDEVDDEPDKKEKGNTEFILGSHKKSILDSAHLPITINRKYKAGDCCLFNGKIIHRGLANLSENTIRHALYITFTAKWYSDS